LHEEKIFLYISGNALRLQGGKRKRLRRSCYEDSWKKYGRLLNSEEQETRRSKDSNS